MEVRGARVLGRVFVAFTATAVAVIGLVTPVGAGPIPIPIPSTPGLVTFATMAGQVEAQSTVSTADGLLAVADKSNGQVALIDPAT